MHAINIAMRETIRNHFKFVIRGAQRQSVSGHRKYLTGSVNSYATICRKINK